MYCSTLLQKRSEVKTQKKEKKIAERTIISPINGGGGHLIYSPLYVMFYEESHFYAPHYQSIRPRQVPQAPVTNSINVPATRSPLPILHSTNLNHQRCENTCNTENSTVRSRNTRETSYLSASNIIEKRTRSSRK